MGLTICILTHNRRSLFTRCIESVVSAIGNTPWGAEVEVLVNNDTLDITEKVHPYITYHYKQFKYLNNVYEYLFNKSTKSHVMFLEDDDYMLPHMLSQLDLSYDINFVEYVRDMKFIKKHIAEFGVTETNSFEHKSPFNTLDQFIAGNTFIDLQLSQLIFNKKCFNSLHGWASTETLNIKNDEVLFYEALDRASTLKYINKKCWVQTTDGGDNLTFK